MFVDEIEVAMKWKDAAKNAAVDTVEIALDNPQPKSKGWWAKVAAMFAVALVKSKTGK